MYSEKIILIISSPNFMIDLKTNVPFRDIIAKGEHIYR